MRKLPYDDQPDTPNKAHNMDTLLAFLFFIGFISVGIVFLLERSKAEKTRLELENKNHEISHNYESLTKKAASLSSKVKSLERFQAVVDINNELELVRGKIVEEQASAKEKIKQLLDDRDRIDAEHQEAIKVQKSEIRQMRKDARIEENNILNRASDESIKIIDEANRRAEEIAGDAYQALKQSHHLTATVRAIQNTIRGYGDEYLIPNHAALDHLAENYTHKQAGMDLKTARARIKAMVKQQTAATCDYAEKRRSTTAIRFVLDAFNGKVDSSLSTVRDNNLGKLQQEIKDSYHLVNEHGKAFRDARILPEYLDARLNELNCAVAVMELKTKEQEEQKRIKQEIREENKAKAEYEKAIKEAEKEEKLLQKLMAEAQAKLNAATETERAEYEAKIAELQQKYTEAEERNRRAISMAQQTKRGHVYVISNIGSFGEDVFKIGLTRRLEPLERVKELGDASVPFSFDVHAMIYNEDAPKLEKMLHHVFTDFQVNKVNPRKEFFRVGVKEIKESLEKIGIEAKWTMKAEAKEYRETLAMEREQGVSPTLREPDTDVATLLASSETQPPEFELQAVPFSEEQLVETSNDAKLLNESTNSVENRHESNGKLTTEEGTLAAAQIASCPHSDCNKDIPLRELKMGENLCPHCNKLFNVNNRKN